MKGMGWFKLIFALIGLGMLAGGVYLYRDTRSFLSTAVAAQGTVVDLVRSRSSSNSGSSYAPVVRFTDGSGRSVEFTSRTSSNPPAYDVGESVEVFYDPARSTHARINGFFSLWGGSLILSIAGAVFLLIGSVPGVLAARRRQAEQALRQSGRRVEAQFQSVERNTGVKVNGRSPFRISAQWRNPQTGEVHVFQSANLWFDPTAYIDRTSITVYLDPRNPRRYFLDTSFLPRLAD